MAKTRKTCDNTPNIGGNYMGGSVHEDKRYGKFTIKIYWEGKQRCISINKSTNSAFPSRAHATKALGIIQGEIDAGTFDLLEWKKKKNFGVRKTVKWYSKIWLKQRQKRVLKESLIQKTVTDDKTHLDKYIIPVFGNKLMTSLTSGQIKDFKPSIDRAPNGVANVICTLKKMLNDAMDDNYLDRVPRITSMKKKSLQPKHFLTIEEQDLILSKIPFADRSIFECMVEYGLRPGEARGLLKTAINNGIIVIESAFSGNTLRLNTKTGVTREYPITTFFQKVLDRLPINNSELVFVRSKDGKRYTSKNLNKIWHKACADAGIGKFKLYNGVRHSKARNLLANGESMDMVAEVLGHASIDMTRQFYADMPLSRIGEALRDLRSRV